MFALGLPKSTAPGPPFFPQHREWRHAGRELLPAGQGLPCSGMRTDPQNYSGRKEAKSPYHGCDTCISVRCVISMEESKIELYMWKRK